MPPGVAITDYVCQCEFDVRYHNLEQLCLCQRLSVIGAAITDLKHLGYCRPGML